MKLAKVRLTDGSIRLASVEEQHLRLLDLARSPAIRSLADILHSENPAATALRLIDETAD